MGMKRQLIGVLLGILGLVLAMMVPYGLQAQERGNLTDLRGRSYTEEDLAKAIFEQTPSDVRTRGPGVSRPSEKPPVAPPSVVPASVALNVLFEFNSDKILRGYYGDLDKLGKVLTAPQYNAYRIQIEGYTDSIGADRTNLRLSQRRAESVKQYLMQNFSIPSNRLVAIGFGKSRPIASNDTPEGRDKNRRVEVVNLGTN